MNVISKFIGPGLMIAAAGIGAGDMIVSIQTGLSFQWFYPVVVLFACLLKYTITEGIGRHQLVSGLSMIERWNALVPSWAKILFLIFFILWSYMVGAAMISGSGLAAHALSKNLSQNNWSLIHSMLALVLVYLGKYEWIEKITSVLITLMFLILIPAMVYYLFLDVPVELLDTKELPPVTLTMALMGGVGGSFTMLSYGYWIKENEWKTPNDLKNTRKDLTISYGITALFVCSLMIVAFKMSPKPQVLKGTELIYAMSAAFEHLYGLYGGLLLKICFWGVVVSSLLTVWSGVPYLFADLVKGLLPNTVVSSKSKSYRFFLLFLSVGPLGAAILENTIKNVVNYTLISSVFVFSISVGLLFLNSSKYLDKAYSNKKREQIILLFCVFAFGALLAYQILNN